MSEPTRPLVRVQERHYSAHHTLLRIAAAEAEKAAAEEPGWFNHAFVALTLSALAIEAFANAIGARAVPDWADFESANPMTKLRLVAEKLEVPFSRKEEPWMQLHWLSKFRNRVAHPKPEKVVVERRLTREEAAAEVGRELPDSTLERDVTVPNASRSVAALRTAIDLLCERLSDEDKFYVWVDGCSSSTTHLSVPLSEFAQGS